MDGTFDDELRVRAERHAALGDPLRLAAVEELAASDRSFSELSRRLGVASNLLAHHLAALEKVGLVERLTSSGDRRRRYLRLVPGALDELVASAAPPAGRAVFVCTANSARSPLAAALWQARTGAPASSAGTHPAPRVHPRAVSAARKAGLDLTGAAPRRLRDDDLAADVVVTVCDRAHEELPEAADWLHWSIPDPAEVGTAAAFDAAVRALDARIAALAG